MVASIVFIFSIIGMIGVENDWHKNTCINYLLMQIYANVSIVIHILFDISWIVVGGALVLNNAGICNETFYILWSMIFLATTFSLVGFVTLSCCMQDKN